MTRKKTIIIEGVKLTEKDFPILYEWAVHNPKWLAKTLRESAKRSKSSAVSVAVCLESDLEHDRAL